MKLQTYPFRILIGLGLTFLSGCHSSNFALPATAESFNQVYTYSNKVDVLWVIDDSGSMAVHQQNMGSQFGSFVNVFLQRSMDFHMAVTTMDMSASGEKGKFLGSTEKVLTNQTADLMTQFSTLIEPGVAGSSLTRGFDTVESAFSSSMLSGVNAGFLRSDAYLALIFISDDNDASAPNPTQFATFLDGVKPPFASGDRAWIANFIGVLSATSACQTGANGFAYPGDRFMQVVAASGGQQDSICSTDLTQALSDIQQRVVNKITYYVLGRTPLAGSIQVTINGTAILQDNTNGWSYDPTTLKVSLHGTAIPGPGADVQINYQPTQAT